VSAHLTGKGDLLVKAAPLLDMADTWKEILHAGARIKGFKRYDALNAQDVREEVSVLWKGSRML
jgi:hypothetical protein